MVRTYYVFSDLQNNAKTLVNENDYKNYKITNEINLSARADGISVYNNFKINSFKTKGDAEKFLNDKTIITKPVMIANKPKLFSDETKTYRQSYYNIQSKDDYANKLERIVEGLRKRNAKSIYVRLTYIRDNQTKPMYKMYSILFDSQLEDLTKNLRNNELIDFEQEDGTMRNYEENGYYFDYSEFDLIFRADIVIGAKITSVDKIVFDKYHVAVISPPSSKTGNNKEYNCLKEILYLIFNNDKQARIKINKMIKSMPALEQIDSEFKIKISIDDILKIEKELHISINFIHDINASGEPVYYYKSTSKNQTQVNFLLHQDHIYIIRNIGKEHSTDITFIKDPEKPVNIFVYIAYDYETLYNCKMRKHIPSMVCCSTFSMDDSIKLEPEGKAFIGENCTKDMITYYEQMYPEYTRIYVGFNSSKFDVFFIINYLIDNDIRPKINVYKDKLFVESDFNIFTDLLPLMSVGSLERHCKDFDTQYQKLKGDVSFHYHNMLYNSEDYANGDLNEYLRLCKNIVCDDDINTSIYDKMVNYCIHDAYCTKDLYKTYYRHVNDLILCDNGLKCKSIRLSMFKTLGELAMTTLLTLQKDREDEYLEEYEREHRDDGYFIRKNKDLKYKYASVIKTESAEETTQIYKYCREALLASISHAKRNTKIFKETLCLIDVVSLYPFILANPDCIFGYGNLTYIEINETYTNIDNEIMYGIYDVIIKFNKHKFQRIPCYDENGTYNWIHNNEIRRKLYSQDINNLLRGGDVEITIIDGYQFEKYASGKEIFGAYINLFAPVKNDQDLLKSKKDPSYSPGLRETCKIFMNIISGKIVQVYGYETELVCKYENIEKSVTENITNDRVFDESKLCVYKKSKKLNSRKEIYDISLMGAQLYCYAREHMQKMLDRIFAQGYTPYVVETDSIIVSRNFVINDIKHNPSLYSGNIIDNKYIAKLKKFGEFDIENDYINELYVYGKKSYYFKFKKGDIVDEKIRFKGTSQNAIIVDKEFNIILKAYAKMKKYYESQFRIGKSNDTMKNDLAHANFLISNRISYELQNKKNSVSKQPIYVFDKLIDGDELTLLQTIIKKNYVTNFNDQLTLENVIITKTFNPKEESEKAVREKGYLSAYEKIKNNCSKLYEIKQLD